MKEHVRKNPGWGKHTGAAKSACKQPARNQEKSIESLKIQLPQGATFADDISRCGNAIRRKHADMTDGKAGFVGAARLVSLMPGLATYAVWLERGQP